MRTMLELIRALSPIRSGVVCGGLDAVSQLLCEELPFEVHRFETGDTVNGWTIPSHWEATKATIHSAAGELIYDGNAHPLGVCSYSKPFIAGIGGELLKQHLFYSEAFPDALIYHCDWWYKPHARDWGLCVPKTLYDTIGDRDAYHVELRTEETIGTMKVLEYVLPGEEEASIVLNAHDCHPGCANDDLSGVAVGIEVMRRIAAVPNRRYTYRLVIAPEHYGSIFYLKRFGSNHIYLALFLESLGSDGEFALQRSFVGDSEMDAALLNALRGRQYYTRPFREIVGNDETCWDSAGHCVPCPSLSRVPFREYHTSLDNPELMSAEKLHEAVEVVYSALGAIDRNAVLERAGEPGLVCLSNPAYDLYQPYFDPSIPGRRTITDEQSRWNALMNCLPLYFDESYTLLEIAQKFGVDFHVLKTYVRQWRDKGLVTIKPAYGGQVKAPHEVPPR